LAVQIVVLVGWGDSRVSKAEKVDIQTKDNANEVVVDAWWREA
jgi:hypothetical protein